MSESSGKYKLAVGSHNGMFRDSKQMLKDIHKSLQHLNVEDEGDELFQMLEQHSIPLQEEQRHLQQQNEQQILFEQQLALGDNISALSQSVAGERRSYPRAIKQFTMEEVSKPRWRNEVSWNGSGGVEGMHMEKSMSYTDISKAVDNIQVQNQQLSEVMIINFKLILLYLVGRIC